MSDEVEPVPAGLETKLYFSRNPNPRLGSRWRVISGRG